MTENENNDAVGIFMGVGFSADYAAYGGFRVKATRDDGRVGRAYVIPMAVSGHADEYVFRVKTQRAEAKTSFAHIIFPTLDRAIEMAQNEAALAVADNVSESSLLNL